MRLTRVSHTTRESRLGVLLLRALTDDSMSAMTNDPFRLARMAGYYKGVQSAGAAVSFAMDAVKTSYLTEHLVSWCLLLVSLPLCFWVLWHCKDTNYDSEKPVHVEDLKASQMDGVAMPSGHHLQADGEALGRHGSGEKKENLVGAVRQV